MIRRISLIKIVSVFLILGIACILIFQVNRPAEAVSKDHETYHVAFVSVRISANDTLWGLAEEYYTEGCGSVKEYVKEIKRCNSLSSDRIYAGNHLVIPLYDSTDEVL